jgi:hypothetical protein
MTPEIRVRRMRRLRSDSTRNRRTRGRETTRKQQRALPADGAVLLDDDYRYSYGAKGARWDVQSCRWRFGWDY